MLLDQIKQNINTALKSRDEVRVSTLRMLLSETNYKQIELQRELTDADVTGVIQKEVKKRREAIDSYLAGGRQTQAEAERQELEILNAYLPAMMSTEQILNELKEIEEIKALKDFGQVMRVVSPKFKGRADGSVVAQTVKEYLGQGA